MQCFYAARKLVVKFVLYVNLVFISGERARFLA